MCCDLMYLESTTVHRYLFDHVTGTCYHYEILGNLFCSLRMRNGAECRGVFCASNVTQEAKAEEANSNKLLAE